MVIQMQIKKLLLERQEMWQRAQKSQFKKKEEEVKDKDKNEVESVPTTIPFRTPQAVMILNQKHVLISL